MTPLEINRKIAALRGHDGVDDDHPYNIKETRLWNWVANIADAWELMKEMPLGYCVSSTHKGFICFFWPSDSEQWPSGEGETASLAICKAYLKYKGVE